MKKLTLAFFLCTLILSGCGLFNQQSKVHFTLEDEPSSSSTRSFSTSGITPTEVIYFDTSLDDPRLIRQSISSGANSIKLPKDSINMVGLIGIDETVSANQRSLSGAITLLGNLEIITNGLDSLPLGTEADDEINLGTLSQGTTSFTSDADLSGVLGLDADAIKGIGGYDGSLTKRLNIDVNQNGIMDDDEGLEWEFIAGFYFLWDNELYEQMIDGTGNYSTILEAINSNKSVSIAMFLRGNVGHGGDDNTILQYEYESGWETIGWVDTMTDDEGSRVEDDGQIIIVFENDGRIEDSYRTETGPWNGNYQIETAGTTYRFNSLKFMNPANSDTALIYPFYKLISSNNDEVYDSLEWTWKLVQDGVFYDVDNEILDMIINVEPYVLVRDFSQEPEQNGSATFPNHNPTGSMALPFSVTKAKVENSDIGISVGYRSMSNDGFQASARFGQ